MLCLYVYAGTERLAIPASAVVEVVPAVRLHPLPHGPEWIAGVFRFRGSVTPVMDLHKTATGQTGLVRLNTRIVVVSSPSPSDPRLLGLMSERVTDLRPLVATGQKYLPTATRDGPDLGPLVADADGLIRLPDLARLVLSAYAGVLPIPLPHD